MHKQADKHKKQVESQCKDDGFLDMSPAFREKETFREIPIDHIHHPLHGQARNAVLAPQATMQDTQAHAVMHMHTRKPIWTKLAENQIGAKDIC